jgi:hypothetical protein
VRDGTLTNWQKLMRLEDWIDPRHLAPMAQARCAAAFSSAPHASVTIDDFLQAEKFAALQRVYSIEGRFEERYYVSRRREGQTIAKDEIVSAEVWRTVPNAHQASHERNFVAPLPLHRMGKGIMTLAKFLELMNLPDFMGFLWAVTGIRPIVLNGHMMRIMTGNHYVRPHNDAGPNRTLCAIFYASAGWNPHFGGRFRHLGPSSEPVSIEPRPNRLLLFEPRIDCPHDVEPITEGGSHWQRWAQTLWFGEPTADNEKLGADSLAPEEVPTASDHAH